MNAFEVLGLEARPALDPETVKEAHLRAMATHHPDAAGPNDHALLLNKARDLLGRDRTRLHHLIELTRGTPAAERGAIPPEIGDLFAPLADVLGKVRGHLESVAGAESAIEKAGLLSAGLELFESLREIQGRLAQLRGVQSERLRELDAAWVAGTQDIEGLERIALALAFLDRWSEQVDEQLYRLSETVV